MVASRTYKTTINKHIDIYNNKMRSKLLQLSKIDTKQSWKLLNSRKEEHCDISISEFTEHFKDLNSTDDELFDIDESEAQKKQLY